VPAGGPGDDGTGGFCSAPAGGKGPEPVNGGTVSLPVKGDGLETDGATGHGSTTEACDGGTALVGAAVPAAGGMARIGPRPGATPGGLAVGRLPEPVSPGFALEAGVPAPCGLPGTASGIQNRPLQRGQTT
jgi:hypothetical protein